RFSPSSLKSYKRGDIIKIHLGYNIGSEEGGLHYAVIVEKDNSIHNPVITIVPLTSLKPNKDLTHLRSGEVFLGNELFSKFALKFKEQFYSTKNTHSELSQQIKELKTNENILRSDVQTLERQQKEISIQLDYLEKMKTEISKMKQGSIALVNQITTVSKIRIYDPKTTKDMFSGITLSDDGLNKIDQEIIKKFTK
ncbi:MAG: type II toxin-antitoxin system PemK/MazF family toxin, partial [Lachnospiraceae bacterium]|nr:type II toxin-antitoxin system PemK/MazF family toxin [Lachnospiraceae bacterium]